MVSFFEKLKGGAQKKEAKEEEIKEEEVKEEVKVESKPKKKTKKVKVAAKEKPREWPEQGGQLAIDVYQTDSYIVIQAPIAGVTKEEIDIAIENDVVTIKGKREEPSENEEKNYFYQECYWGPFSREIILPDEGDPSRTEATMEEGVLILKIPRIQRGRTKKIQIK